MPNLTSLRVCRALIILIAAIAAGCGDGGEPPEDPGPVEVSCDHPYRVTNEGVNDQIAFAGQTLPSELTVQVTCANSNARHNSSEDRVTWTVVSGGGLVDGVQTLTSTKHHVQWQLGPTIGVQELRADYTDTSDGTLTSTTFRATANARVVGCNSSATGTPQAPSPGDRTITADETWKAAQSPHRGGTVHVREGAVLTIEAGATVCLGALLMEGGRLVAQGMAGAPIVFAGADPSALWGGLVFYPPTSALAGPSMLSFVDIQNPLDFTMLSNHPVQIRDSRLSRSEANTTTGWCPSWYLTLSNGPGGSSVVERVVVERFGGPGCPAVEIVPDNTPMGSAFSFGARVLGSRGDAVRVQGVRVMGAANTLNISSCEISGSAGDGLVWTDDSQQQLSVSSCNLTGNAGVGIRNQTISGQLMARDNWWGDAAGPGGLNGDGVAGNVAAAAPLAAPVSLGY